MNWTRSIQPGRPARGAHLRLVEDLTAAVAYVTEIASLRALISRHVRDIAQCDAVVFCAYQDPRAAFVPVTVEGQDVSGWDDAEFSEHGALARWLRVNEDTLRLPDERGAETFLDDPERQALGRHSVRAVVPMLWMSRLIGILLIVSTQKAWRLTADDASLLAACGHQAAIACDAVGRHDRELERVRSAGRAQQLAVAGQLAAAVAHEVRNPLTAIRSTLQFVLNSSQPWSETKTLVADLVAEVDRIERTVSGILSLSRPAALVEETVELCDVIGESVRLVQAYAEHQRVAIEIATDPGTLPVRGDARELRQVFVNILFNACQAMLDGGRVTVRHRMVPGSGPGGALNALVEVQDTGAGMAESVLQRVFDPFFTTKAAGTGLGLPICLEIISRHRGDIRLASEVGRGTLVSVLIPLREPL